MQGFQRGGHFFNSLLCFWASKVGPPCDQVIGKVKGNPIVGLKTLTELGHCLLTRSIDLQHITKGRGHQLGRVSRLSQQIFIIGEHRRI